MTDRSTPTIGMVEDRVRRTLASRADDIDDVDAGDADGPFPPFAFTEPPAASSRARPRRGMLVAAAGLVVVAVAAACVAFVGRTADRDDTGDVVAGVADQSASPVALVVAPRGLVEALQDERAHAVVTLVGMESAVMLPVTRAEQARANTDAAVTELAELVADSPDDVDYTAWLDGLGALDQLRTDIDSLPGPRNLDQIETALAVSDRYSEVIGGLLDAQKGVVSRIDDPVVQAGGDAYRRGLRLQADTSRLASAAVFAAIDLGPTTVEELAWLHATVQQQLDELVPSATGTPYQEAAVTAVDEVRSAGVIEASAAVLGGSSSDLVPLGRAIATVTEQGVPAFLDRIEDSLSDG